MTDFWSFLLQTLTASGVAALLLIVKAMFRDKLSPRWQFTAWGVLGVILLFPAGMRGRHTLFNWPFYVELLRSSLTGEYGSLARVAAPIPLPSFAPPETVWNWLYLIYVAGVAFFLLRYLVSYVRLRLVLRRGRPVENSRVQAVAAEYGLPVCSAIEVDDLPSAFVCGMFRPVLALPAAAEVDDKVLLHELLHLKYKDVIWGWIIALFRCLHWCNPLIWLCADLAGNDLESLCDQRVLERLEGEDRRDYGRILLSMADEKYARAPGTSSMANGGKNIRRRIEAIARFKKYPAGMALVSVCVLLVLTVPLVVGARAELQPQGALNIPMELASARTTYCTTYAGAFDAYAKSVLTGRFSYRAMCAPLSEQNALAESYRTSAAQGHREWTDVTSDIIPSYGYKIYNLTSAGKNAWEGILAVTRGSAPEGEEWDGTVAGRWMVVQLLRVEKEGERWVVIPQSDLRPLQGDTRDSFNFGLPAWEYAAQAGDFTLRILWQTTSAVDSYEQPEWFFESPYFSATPIPGGEFTTTHVQTMVANYTGAPEDKSRYQSIGVFYRPMWADKERPDLRSLDASNSTGSSFTGESWSSGSSSIGKSWAGSSSTGESWGQITLDRNWGDTIYLGGGGNSRGGFKNPPSAYAADFYLNGEKKAELTLPLMKGGLDVD